MTKTEYKTLLKAYEQAGASKQELAKLAVYNLKNEGKLRFEMKRLSGDSKIEIDAPKAMPVSEAFVSKGFGDLISEYPPELHLPYKNRMKHWLEACSLKLKLNEINEKDEGKAYDLQVLIMDEIDAMDACQKALRHYKEYKRILPTSTEEDYSKLSPMELLTRRNNLRSNISKRLKTLEAHEKNLPSPDNKDYRRKLNGVNSKREQLNEMLQQEKKLTNIINKP